jgi:hypothetical protein
MFTSGTKKSTWARRSAIALAGSMLALTAVTTIAHAAPGQGGGLRTLIDSGVITRDQAYEFKEEVDAVEEQPRASPATRPAAPRWPPWSAAGS